MMGGSAVPSCSTRGFRAWPLAAALPRRLAAPREQGAQAFVSIKKA